MQSEGHLKKNFMRNLALNLSNLGDGSGNWLVLYKIQSTVLLKYLFQLFPTNNHSYTLRKLLKGALLGLRQFLATGIRLKMMKNVFYFTSKALSVLKIFKFLP